MVRKFLFVLMAGTLLLSACAAPEPAPSVADAWACDQAQSPNWGGGGLGDAYYPLWGNDGIDVQHYDVNLTVDTASNKVDGEAKLDIIATQDLDAFNLDFFGMEITGLQVNGAESSYCRNTFGELTVLPLIPIKKDEAFTLSVKYNGTPAYKEKTSQGYPNGWYSGGDSFFAFPGPDLPSFLYPANEYHTDLATYTFHITVPSDYQAFTIGTLKETSEQNGMTTSVWDVDYPLVGSSFIAIGKYPSNKTLETADGLKVNMNFTASADEKTQAAYDALLEIMDYYNSVFGEFPYSELGITWVDNLPTAAITVPGRIFVNTNRVEKILTHELAREWFGVSLVPAAVEDTWLTEGMAIYASVYLWDEHIGTDINDQISSEYANLPLNTAAPGIAATYENTSDIVYFRSAIGLHALRLKLGDETFFNILKTFASTYKYKVIKTSDFIATAEEVSGQQLDEFFDAWLYKEAVPDIPELHLSKGNE